MMRQGFISMMAAAVVLPLGLCELSGRTAAADVRVGIGAGIAVSPYVGVSLRIGSRPQVRVIPHDRIVVTRAHRHLFTHLGPRPSSVSVRGPVVPEVVIARPSVVEVELSTLTAWVTNSNGSKTAVELTRHGSCYVGPRGEWYTSMPTNEQLRIVYGF
jgi:hypothetical protein